MNNRVFKASTPAAEGERGSYAKELRALGQALEARQVVALDLVVIADVYAVRAKARLPKGVKPTLIKLWSAIVGKHDRSGATQTIDLRYKLKDVMELDRVGCSQRTNPQGAPNPNALSQILRSAGSYLDLKERSSLIGIALEDRWVTIRYQGASGQPQETRADLEYFYDYWVKMYLRRGNRQ